MTTKAALLPCPFCGGEAELREWDWPYERFQVRCSVCKTAAKTRLSTREKAIAAWNTRQLVPREAVEAEKLALALADAEAEYRRFYQAHGAGDMRTGRAWDKMRRRGDMIRAALAAITERTDDAN